MKTYMYKLSIFFLIFTCVTFFISINNVHAIGISPSPIVRDNVANGVKMLTRVNIVRGNADVYDIVEVSVQGDGARYITLTDTEFYIPKGKNHAEYTFYISPNNAPNGVHEAKIFFVKKANSGDGMSTGSGVAMQEAVATRVVFTVVDTEIKKIVVSDVAVEKQEVGMPFTFSYGLSNEGNVDTRLDEIRLHLVDNTDESNVFEKVYSQKSLPLVTPGTFDTYTMSEDIGKSQGEYTATIEFLYEGQLVHSYGNIHSILPPGSLGVFVDFSSFETEKDTYAIGEPVEFLGSVENTGQVGIKTTFYVEIKKDGKRIDLLRSEDIFIIKDRVGDFFEEFIFSEKGEYTIDGWVEYGARRSDKQHLTIHVENPGEYKTFIMVGIGIVICVLILLGIYLFTKKKHKKKVIKKRTKKTAKKKKNK